MKKVLLVSGLATVMAFGAQAQFVPGNLAVLRCGNGTSDIINKSVSQNVFIDQFIASGTNTAPVNTVSIPSTGGIGGNEMVMEGGATSEGGLTRAIDRTVLAITGYSTNVVPGVEYDGLSAAACPRNIGTVDAFGNYIMQQIATGDFTKQDPRFVATDGTNNFWAVGGATGVIYLNPPTAANTIINSSIANNRNIRIFNGNLYFSSQKSTPIGVFTIASSLNGPPAGLVESASGVTNLVVAALAGNVSDFAISPNGNTVYIADQAQGIQKYTINGSLVTSNYTIPVATGAQPKGAFSLAVDFSQANPVIYATTEETNTTSSSVQAGNHLAMVIDTGASSTFTYLAQAPTNEVYRGIDFTPDLRPLIASQPAPANNNVTFGTAGVTISVGATSPFPLFYQWRKNGASISDDANVTGTSTATLTFNSAFTTNSGNYSVIVTNNNGTAYYAVTSAVAVLTVSAPTPPVITTQPANQPVYLGATATFIVAASGVPTPTYQWYEVEGAGDANPGQVNMLSDSATGPNGETYSGSATATLVVSGYLVADSGNVYYAIASNSANTAQSGNATLTVQLILPTITAQPAAQVALPGGTASFTVGANGSYLGFQWMYITNGGTNFLMDGTGPNGEIITGSQPSPSGSVYSSTSTLQISGVVTNDAGYYAVEAFNSANTNNSQSALLTVLVLPPPSVVNYSTAGSVYTNNFDSLPNLGPAYMATVKASNPVIANGTNYSLGAINPYFDFAAPILTNGLPGGLGLSNTMSGWYGWSQGGSGANVNYFGVNGGDFTTGGIQDYGPTNSYAASTNRALGVETTSSFGPGAFAAQFTNATASTLASMNINFLGELWRQADLAKTLWVYYYVDTTGTNTFDSNLADYTPLPSLAVNFATNPNATGGTNVDGTGATSPSGPLVPSLPPQAYSLQNQSITWPAGASLWVVFEYTNTAGKSQGIGIDNFGFSATPAPAAPAVTTLSVSNITATTATLDASVNPNFASTAYWFNYGTTSSYGSSTPTNTITSQMIVTGPITGLTASTMYHYQIVSSNSVSVTAGPDSTFTTTAVMATPPTLSGASVGSAGFKIAFTNYPGLSFSVLATNDLTAPVSTWPVVGSAIESPAGSGKYMFTNSTPTNAALFYMLRH